MAKMKYMISMATVLCTLVLLFYSTHWEESQKYIVPAPVSFRPAQSPKVMVENKSLYTSKYGLNIDMRGRRPNDTVFGEKWSNSSGNIKSVFDVTNQLPSFSDLHVLKKKPCIKQIQQWSKRKFSITAKEYNCPEENCKARFVYSNSYEKMATSHALILHHKGSWEWEDLARFRPDGQLWIYMTKESPLHSKKLFSPDPQLMAYNWSMTYHTESDFVIPYGRYIEGIPEISANDNRNWATGKTRLIAWMASNCAVTSWRRTKFVRSLKHLIQVDTYGSCGELKCPRNDTCDEILSSHKFYLALENSECEDYITEKFWKNAFTHRLVPIAYGTTREDYEKVAPPNSFIHLSDFRNLTSMVDYIKYLDKNDTAYNEYFDWKKLGCVVWYSESQVASPESLLCPIVHKLREVDNRRTKRVKTKSEVVDIKTWWNGLCHHRRSIWDI